MPYVERDSDGTITVSPPNAADQSALVVICHGLGDTAEGFADVAEQLASKMPYVKFILPTAPTRPVTLNMGMRMPAWYDIIGLDERSNEDCAGLEESVVRLQNILQREHDDTNLPYSRMVLAGFSQGAALSLYTGLTLPSTMMTESQRLAGIVCLSGYLPAASKLQITPGLEQTNIWHGHGTDDMVVACRLAHKSKQHLTENHGVPAEKYTIQEYHGMQHSVSPRELADVLKFLEHVLPPDETAKIRLPDPAAMSVKELKAAIRRASLTKQAAGMTEKSELVLLLTDYQNGKL